MPTPGFHSDIPLAALACFYEHIHEFYEQQPWLKLEPRFRMVRLSMDTLGWKHAYATLRSRDDSDFQIELYRSLDAWRADGERLLLLRRPRRHIEARQLALMEEFEWLAPIALQPTAEARDAHGRRRMVTTSDLQRLAATAITFERLAEEMQLQPPPENATWLEATLEIEDELWNSRIRAQTPPPSLLGVRLEKPLRPLRQWLAEGDDEFTRFLDFVDRRDTERRELENFRDPSSERLGPELLFLSMGPYLVQECASLPEGSKQRIGRALFSFQSVLHRMIDDGAIEAECLDEFRTGLVRQGKLLGDGVEFAAILQRELPRADGGPSRGNVRRLMRIESRDQQIVQLESREGERLVLQFPPAAARLRDGWWLDLTFRRGDPLDELLAVHALLPPGMAMHVDEVES